MVAESTIQKTVKKFAAYRNDFPALQEGVNGKPFAYLDTAASAQKPQHVIDVMSELMQKRYANIHRGLYKFSQDLTAEYEAVRVKVADFLAAPSENNIVFTRNATEAINLVAQSWGRANLCEGDEIILSEMEHHANIVPWQILEKEIGFRIRVVPILDDGTLDLEAFEQMLTDKTKFLGVVHVSNALGTINPVRQMIKTVRDFNEDIVCLVDGSQAVAHDDVNVQNIDADFYVFTGHKLYGPTGVGVLYGRYEILNAMPPYQGGGDMIERVSFAETTFKEAPFKFEAGTPPIVEVIGLGAAIDYVRSITRERIAAWEDVLLDFATHELLEIEGLRLYTPHTNRAAVLSFTIDDLHPADVAMILDQDGVAVRTGHHCCMPLMQRFGIDGTIRASIGLYTNKDDINQLLNALAKAKRLLS